MILTIIALLCLIVLAEIIKNKGLTDEQLEEIKYAFQKTKTKV